MEEHTETKGGWIALLVTGVINLVWAVLYFLWTLLGLVFGGLTAIFATLSIIADGGGAEALFSVVYLITPLIQIVVYLVAIAMAAATVFGAMKFKSLQSKGTVWAAIVFAVLAPLLGVFSSVTSFCNIGAGCSCCFGFLFGNIGTLPVLVIAIICAAYAAFVMSQDEATAGFEANA